MHSSSDRELFGQANILVVGAGGIGCELIKNLALLGVNNITVIDLDTIDVTNLNRQFLFRRHHVDRAKAEVAAEAARRLNPQLTITHFLQKVQSPSFSTDFVSVFDCVLSALDNIDARKHLNRLCLAANRPLIEAGSAGYIGQCQVIQKGISECYECQRKEKPKQFPVCTIRSTPSTPVHCVHWARMLFDVLFGPEDSASMLADLRRDLDASSTTQLFRFLFDTEIAKQAAIEELWKDGRIKPVCLSIQATDNQEELGTHTETALSVDALVCSFIRTIDRIRDERAELIGSLSFTKDDPLAVDFVSAAANLRMTNYHIPTISRFQVESIAGAIIPAVATTNAIVAGLQCLNLKKLLRAKAQGNAISGVKDVWVQFPRPTASGFILQPSVPSPPKPDCFACSNNYRFARLADFSCTINTLVHDIIRPVFDFAADEVFTVFTGTNIIYDPYEDEDQEQMGLRSLSDWEIESGSILQIETEAGLSAQLVLLNETSPASPSHAPIKKPRLD